MSGVWMVSKVPTTRAGSRRAFVWEVTCPDEVPEPSWDNDFGRGRRCRCRRFPSAGKANRYVEKQKSADAGAGE